MPISPLIVTETHVPLDCTWQDDAGNPFDLTGATLTVRFAAAGGTPAPFAGTGTFTVTSAVAGQFTYKYSNADVATAGTYQVQFKAVFTDTTILIADALQVVISPAV